MLVHRFGFTFDEIQNQPGLWLDWMLHIDQLYLEHKAANARKPS